MKKKEILIVLLILGFVYLLLKMKKKTTLNDIGNGNGDSTIPVVMDGDGTYQPSNNVASYVEGKCINPKFQNLDINGRNCAGSQINESKLLSVGDNGCEVLLLQQRLNSMETERNILVPNGQFCCNTKAKLISLLRVPEISLNQFSSDEQLGFDELVGGTKITPYSYMDLTTKEKTHATRR
jgi:hypothetical protein